MAQIKMLLRAAQRSLLLVVLSIFTGAAYGAELFKGYQDNTDFARNLHRLIGGR